VCPVDNCIEMVEVAPERASTTWDEISRNEPAVTEDWDAMAKYRETHGIHIH
jgi:dihydropyrimidine dehydrogenase (NAD+) subunit PreA